MPFKIKKLGVHLQRGLVQFKSALSSRLQDPAYRQKCLGLLLFLLVILLLRPTTIRHVAPPLSPILTPTPTPVATPGPTLFDPFPFPEKLTAQVAFWKKIFTEYTSTQVVLHDNWYVNVVYEVIDLRSPEFASEREGWEAVNTAQEKYVKLLASMAKQWETPEKMTDTERQVYQLFQALPESPYFKKKAAQDRIRAQVGQADRFKAGLIRASGYFPAMQQIVAEYGVPEKIVYLPMIESTFNPLAESFVGAAGVWQFMRATGQEYHLAINAAWDERKDPLRATKAAAQMLAHNYDVIQSWPLAITAYNHGLQGIKNAADHVSSTDLGEIVEKYDGPRFGFASRNFYAEFLAAVEICLKYRDYFGDLELEPPLTLTQVKIPDYVSVKTLEKYTPFKAAEIARLNPALHKSIFEPGNFLPKNYPLNVLLEQQKPFETGYASIPAALKYNYLAVKAKHRVKAGQTLASIAKQYQTTVKALVKLNNLAGQRKVKVGQMLKIPGDYVSLARKNNVPPAPGAQAETKHRVQKGQTLATIAKQYQTTVAALLKFNQLVSSRKIKMGQMLTIPDDAAAATPKLLAQKNEAEIDAQAPAHTPKTDQPEDGLNPATETAADDPNAPAPPADDVAASQPAARTPRVEIPPNTTKPRLSPTSVQRNAKHQVQKGQSLETIAKRYNTTVKAITRFNKLMNPRKIKIGQVLKIPPG